MLRRIKICGYKSLVDVNICLEPLSVIFGPNSAGKSNFLDALQLLSRLATSRTLKDAFDPPYRGTPLESFAFRPEGVRGLLSQQEASFSIEADIELSEMVIDTVNRQVRDMKRSKATSEDGSSKSRSSDTPPVRERYMRYRLEVEILPKTGILRVIDEYMAALTEAGEPNGRRRPFLERVGERLHLRMEGQAHPTYHERYLDHTILSLPLYPPHYPHLVSVRQELSSWFFSISSHVNACALPTRSKKCATLG